MGLAAYSCSTPMLARKPGTGIVTRESGPRARRRTPRPSRRRIGTKLRFVRPAARGSARVMLAVAAAWALLGTGLQPADHVHFDGGRIVHHSHATFTPHVHGNAGSRTPHRHSQLVADLGLVEAD